MFRSTGPDFLSRHHIVITVLASEGTDAGGICAAGWFGHSKCLQPQIALCDLGQVELLLLEAAVFEYRAHGVHLGMTRPAVTARSMDLFEYGCRCGEPQPRTTVFLGYQYR